MTGALHTAAPWAALCIALPLAAGLAALPLGKRAWPLHLFVAPAGLALAWMIWLQVGLHGPFTYAMGGWSAPLGIQLRVDGLAAAFVAACALVAAVVAAYAARHFHDGGGETRAGFAFHPLFLFLWAGLNGVFLSGDLFNLYVALELLTLGAVALVALGGQASAVAAALRYMLFALLGSVAYLAGTALIYGAYGVLGLEQIEAAIRPEPASWIACALITVGLAAKTALFPLHAWLPPAHGGAPAPASAILSALVVKAPFYILLRLWFDAFEGLGASGLLTVLGGLGAAAVVYGSAAALRQRRLKLVVAYSTVAQIGYLFLAFPLAGQAGAWSGAVFHGLSHALAKAAMFLAAGALMLGATRDDMSGLRGLGRTMPVAVFAFGISAMSLIGLPPSGGFTAKYLLMTAAAGAGQWFWACVPLLGGLLAAGYLFRPLGQMLRKPEEGAAQPSAAPMLLQAAPLALALAAMLLGVLSNPAYRQIEIGSPPLAWSPAP